jgi:hypothetical protein
VPYVWNALLPARIISWISGLSAYGPHFPQVPKEDYCPNSTVYSPYYVAITHLLSASLVNWEHPDFSSVCKHLYSVGIKRWRRHYSNYNLVWEKTEQLPHLPQSWIHSCHINKWTKKCTRSQTTMGWSCGILISNAVESVIVQGFICCSLGPPAISPGLGPARTIAHG